MSNQEENKGKIISDENWKEQAKQEKIKLEEQKKHDQARKAAQATPLPPADFITLINSVTIQILFCLGKIQDPKSGKPTINLDLAKHHIDMLQVIEEKTKGNLTDEESKSLAMALHEMRMQYVQSAQT